MYRNNSGMNMNEDKHLLLKTFLRRFHNNETTPREKKVVELLKNSYNPSNGTPPLSDKELRIAIKRNRRAVMKRIEDTKYQIKTEKRPIALIIGGCAAAVALIFIILTFSFNENFPFTDSSQQFSENEKQFNSYNEMKKMLLPDGSEIYMNKGTIITLKETYFDKYTREIWLEEGEAFFEIKKDIKRPFIVHTPNGISTKVLGTSFNIKAYKNIEEQVVSVNTGCVEVYDDNENRVILAPNYKVTVKSNEKNEFIYDRTDALSASEWRTGKILLENASIKEVAFRLKQVFDIDLVYNNIVNENEKIVTSFTVHTREEDVITTICKLYNVKFKRENNRVELIK